MARFVVVVVVLSRTAREPRTAQPDLISLLNLAQCLTRALPEGSSFPHNHARWGEAFIIVYSVTDSDSLHAVRDILSRIRRIKGPKYIPILILGNKRDLEHARRVDASTGELVAMQQGCQFAEVSAAESPTEVMNAFQAILREARAWKFEKNLPRQRKLSMLAVSKMLNSFIRKTSAPAFPPRTQMFVCPDSREALKDFEELLKEVERGTPPPSSSIAEAGHPINGKQIERKISVFAPRDYQMLIIGAAGNASAIGNPSSVYGAAESSWEIASRI